MRVLVYKDAKGNLDGLVVASPGKGRPPVMVRGLTLENVRERILPVVVGLRKPKGEPTGLGDPE